MHWLIQPVDAPGVAPDVVTIPELPTTQTLYSYSAT